MAAPTRMPAPEPEPLALPQKRESQSGLTILLAEDNPINMMLIRELRGRRATADSSGTHAVTAPMPGRVIRVLVGPGQEVAAGEGLIVVEAMKMQNEMKAPRAGRVAAVKTIAGATVSAGDVLLVIE